MTFSYNMSFSFVYAGIKVNKLAERDYKRSK